MREYIKKIALRFYFKIKYKNRLLLGKNVRLTANSRFYGINRIKDNSVFNGIMSGGSYIGQRSHIYGKVGQYCSIGDEVMVLIATHPIHFISTSPVFYSTALQAGYSYTKEQLFDEYKYADKENKLGVIIGNDVWIGSGVKIIGGVEIGDGAVILANAVVTKNVPPYAIVGGVPGEIIKYRFSETQIDSLLKLKWWDKPESWLRENVKSFMNIEDFINKHK